jgi:hypothetical protein
LKHSTEVVTVEVVISVGLRDAVGERLFLTGGFHHDGILFDVRQAHHYEVGIFGIFSGILFQSLTCREHSAVLHLSSH